MSTYGIVDDLFWNLSQAEIKKLYNPSFNQNVTQEQLQALNARRAVGRDELGRILTDVSVYKGRKQIDIICFFNVNFIVVLILL